MLPRQHLLPYLVIDWTGLRLGALEEAKVRDLDERRQAFLARASVAKNEKPIWLALHDVLFEAVLAELPPREDRDLDAPLFPGFKGANLRTAITRACKATGTPHFSPHGLRKRRGSLLSKQGYSLAEIAERLGDTKVVTAEHYLLRASATTPRSTTRSLSTADRPVPAWRGRPRSALAWCRRRAPWPSKSADQRARSNPVGGTWAVSSVGRAPGLHPGGRRFEPVTAHRTD